MQLDNTKQHILACAVSKQPHWVYMPKECRTTKMARDIQRLRTKYYQVSTFILHFYSFGSLLACHNCPWACPQRAVKCFFSVTAVLSKFNSNLYFQSRKDGKILCEYICALKSKILWKYCSPVHTLAHYKDQCRRLVIDEGILLVITEFYHFGIAWP